MPESDAIGADHESAVPPAGAAGAGGSVRFDGNGNYVRDDDGVWRYTGTPVAVPGARDLTVDEAYPAVLVPQGDRRYRRVPRRWVPRRTGHALAWILDDPEVLEVEGGAVLLVPETSWADRAGDVVGMLAPELHPQHLVDLEGAAGAAGVALSTVRAYLARGQMPAPVARVGGSPVWSRPVIDQWLSARRGPSPA